MRSGANHPGDQRVRKRLSLVKGGGLVRLSPTKKIVSLIISDIVGDPIDLIASGPTVLDATRPDEALHVIERYRLQHKTSPEIMEALKMEPLLSNPEMFEHVINVVVGSNEVGLQYATKKAEDLGFVPYLLTSTLSGNAGDVVPIFGVLSISPESAENLLIKLRHARFHKRGFCLVMGGETTVVVRGNGLGGRCQHLALSAAIEMEEHSFSRLVLLSAGTDGIDGPTDAAGAVVYPGLAKRASQHDLDAKTYLLRNDSYNFFNRPGCRNNLVVTGHTGTNCMDIVLLLFDWSLETAKPKLGDT
ncbi:GLYCTK, partial [Cordylochernes scorpioides]